MDYPALQLTIRFSTAHPDLTLDRITHPEEVSGLSRLDEIRRHLPAPQSQCKILLIAGGRVLALKESLALSLRLERVPKRKLVIGRKTPDSHVEFDFETSLEHKGKGKERVSQLESASQGDHSNISANNAMDRENENTQRPLIRQIIHATFSNTEGGLLSNDDIQEERLEGVVLNAALREQEEERRRLWKQSYNSTATPSALPQASSSAIPQQRKQQQLLGFSRLLSTGVPESEITALRNDFRAIIAAENPDAPPLTPMELLILEERWLDSNDTASDRDISSLTSANLANDNTNPQTTRTTDILWGNVLGFFWPLGALFFLGRQQGIWRDAKGLAVIVGALINIMFCLFRLALVGAGTEMENATPNER